MLISNAHAQAELGGMMGGGFEAFIPLILIFVVFYFLLIRPQQKKMKAHKEMLAAVKRGDNIITGGGVFGKVHKVQEDGVLQVDIAENVRVKVARDMVSAVVDKTQPAGARPANENRAKSGGLLSSLFGGKDNNRKD
ncbi:MAG: preprotein translocase subunit YajC [Rhodospirillales bacterium]